MADAPLHDVLHYLAGISAAPSLADATDGDLLERFASQRDQAAFAVLLRRHGPMVLNVCRRLLGQAEDAEDVFQAAFLLLARQAANIRKRDAVGSWLYGVAYRLASKARARRLRRQVHEWRAGMRKHDEGEADLKAAWRQVQETLDEALWRLPEKYRAVLILCYLEGMSHEEAARQLGCPLATLRSRLTRGREKLRAMLVRHGLDLSASGLAALVAANAVEGALPATLRLTTLRAAARFAVGEPANQVVSATVAQLIEGGLQTMWMSKLKLSIVVVAAALLTTGAGVAAFRALAAPQPAAQQDENRTTTVSERSAAEKEQPKPIRKLAVHVVDDKGKPVADAEVYFLVDYEVSTEGRTDAEGRWSGRVPADAKQWGLFARKANVGFDYAIPTPRPGSLDEMRPLPEEVKLTLDGARTLRVKTVDRHGKPISGVMVGPWYIEKPSPEGTPINRRRDINLGGLHKRWLKTDKNGIVVLDWLPRRFKQAIPILAHHDDYFALDHATPLLAEKPVEELTISLLPMEKLSGRVTHADGRPAAGIVVAVAGQGCSHNYFRGSAQTDAEGHYALKVYSDYAYIVAVQDKRWAAPYRSGIVVRAGKPVEGVDFVLGRATRLHGRITVGKDGRPASGMVYFNLTIDKGDIPPELRRPNDSSYHPVQMYFHGQIDKDGRYEFYLGPGEYLLQTQIRVEAVKITIPVANPPAEIVRDVRLPRPETGRFTGRVVDAEGKPIAGAVVDGTYAAQSGRWFPPIKTDEQGRFTVERSLDPLVLHAQTADKTSAGVVRIDAEAPEGKIVLGPLAKASGRLLDLQGNPIRGKELRYGIRVHVGDPRTSPFADWFGGTAMTDTDGRFTLINLIPGETYHIDLPLDEHSSIDIKQVKPSSAQALDLGDLRADPTPRRPYVPPTPAQRTADAFAANKQTTPRQRLRNLLNEAPREYTKPLLLFGSPKDPACVELFRSFNEESEQPSKLRWEFELASLDVGQTSARELAMELGVSAGKDHAPTLAVLDAEGALVATHALRLNEKHKLDAPALTAFLQKHKLATRDAEQMLAEAREKAKAESKRVFFIASASWCGPCRRLSRYLSEHKAELERHYVFVKIDISRDRHADSLCKRLQEGKHQGVPWYAVLDADAKVLITSNAPAADPQPGSSNIGFPSSPEAIEHFLTMLKQTAPRLSQEQQSALRKGLERN
ncbi:MAG TPA: sigma-70 family RNA polymerase sigma factor [Gemmataceae bacterium]|nr:sigma-70 family RNA polymerase sigma factor [Gemmataceae bacterium]